MPNTAAIYGVNRAKGRQSTSGGIDKIPMDPCRLCSEQVYFDTDGRGNLQVWNRDLRTLHRHQEGA